MLDAGATTCLKKPLDFQSLRKAIAACSKLKIA
jgi:hypothetical protein